MTSTFTKEQAEKTLNEPQLAYSCRGEPKKKSRNFFTLGAGVLFLAGSVAPIVPQEMVLTYSYSVECSALENITTTSERIVPSSDRTPYKPTVCNDMLYVSVFSDERGNTVYKEITASKYGKMGEVDGHLSNTKNSELVSIFDALTPRAEAAIAFDAYTQCRANPATSCTVSHTVTGSNTILAVGAFSFPSAAIPTGCTANGSAMTLINWYADSTANRDVYLYLKVAPSTGNIVCSISASSIIYFSASSYNGVTQTGQPIASTTDFVASGTSISSTLSGLTITTNAAGTEYMQANSMVVTAISGDCWLIHAVGTTVGNLLSAGSNTTLRGQDTDQLTGISDSNGTSGGCPAAAVLLMQDNVWSAN